MYQKSNQSRLGRYEQGERYMDTLEQRARKLNEDTRHNLNMLPQIYAKAAELNRKLVATKMNYCSFDDDVRSTPTDDFNDDDVSLSNGCMGKERRSQSLAKKYDDETVREHKKALVKRTMVISQCLDDDIRHRLENFKYGGTTTPMSMDDRRYSELDRHSGLLLTNEDDDDVVLSSRGGDAESAGVIGVEDDGFNDDDDLFMSPSELKEMAMLRINGSRSRMSGGDFAANLSADGQHALLKSLEDNLIRQIETIRPDLVDKILPPNKNNQNSHSRRTCINMYEIKKKAFNDELDNSNKRRSLVLKQIEIVSELLEELKKSSKQVDLPTTTNSSPAKKQIHFSASSDVADLESNSDFRTTTKTRSIVPKRGSLKSTLHNRSSQQQTLTPLTKRPPHKSISSLQEAFANNTNNNNNNTNGDSTTSSSSSLASSSNAADRISFLLTKYAQLKRFIE